MADYDRVERFMEGIGFTTRTSEFDRKVLTEKSRRLAIPIGKEVLWVVFNPETLEASTVQQIDISKVTVHDTFQHVTNRRGKVTSESHSVGSWLGGVPDKLDSASIPEGSVAALLVKRYQGHAGGEGSLVNSFGFDDQGMLSLYGCRSMDYPLSTYTREFDTFMDNVEALRSKAGI